MPRIDLPPILSLALGAALLLPLGCRKASTTSGTTPEPEAATPAPAPDPELDPKWPTVRLNGELMSVRWSDGDSFKFKSGPHDGHGVRLQGYNTLESYGPVHRWGDWTAAELYVIAKAGWKLGASETWDCTTTGDQDHYGRLLVDCPAAALKFVSEGQAVAFGMDAAPAPDLLEAQIHAMKQRKGIWEKGTPGEVITSLHSSDEDGGGKLVYNRVVDTRTGMSREAEHKATYATCQEVCMGTGADESCMTYVPFVIRYKNKPECLSVKGSKAEHAAEGKSAEESPETEAE